MSEEAASTADTSSGGARERFAEAIRALVRDRNYALPYVARRCRVTEATVGAWLRGQAVPDVVGWNYLCRMAPDVSLLYDLWRDASEALWRDAADARAEARAEVAEVAEVTEAPEPSLPSVTEAPPVQVADGGPRSEAPVAGAEAPPAQIGAEPVSGGRILYSCRLSGGRFLRVELPGDLTTEDVARLCAFLRTQAVDFTPAC